ncbi:TetR/AcrR family transcriptional regulator [Pseudaquidulcibacter saccharophilus]|uniref:TetR/AcrR family transcriptional regulator n=1 Tax=Pseudaquidulcibacter saccharophilus TaxID=2831900 RepID=UPI001EFF4E7C|nr:TetR/AcrR family transcriptional regulator [Pseudaquidulcibacter saccharophilus]
MRRSPQKVEDIEKQIADAALRLGNNIDGYSIQELAKKAELAVGTIYRVLPNKQQLDKLLEERCEEVFCKFILAPIPARLDMKGRFALVFDRLTDFIEQEPEVAEYLATHGFKDDSKFKTAITAFIDEAAVSGDIDIKLKPIALSLIWGPIASLLQCRGDKESAKILKESVWAALKS